MQFYIETERLILRDLLESDVDKMFELDSDPLVHKYLGNNPIKTKNKALEYIINVKQHYKERGIGRWATIEKSSGDFIGWSGLRFYNKDEAFNGIANFYDVGYRLIPKYWGKGYATESGKAAIKYGFDELDIDTIYGITELKNQASHYALMKIGLDYIEDFYNETLNEHLRWYKIKK